MERCIAMEEKEDRSDGGFHIDCDMGVDGGLPFQLHHGRQLGGHGGCYLIFLMGQHVQTSWEVRIHLYIHELIFWYNCPRIES